LRILRPVLLEGLVDRSPFGGEGAHAFD
jgi:hypothetical protein